MRKSIWVVFTVVTLLFYIGCTSKRGIIELNTRPEGSAVYYNNIYMGETPVKFEYDFRNPATLKIEKEGYYTESEMLGEGWVVREYQKGNYDEGTLMIQGEAKKAWRVNTIRNLQKKDEE